MLDKWLDDDYIMLTVIALMFGMVLVLIGFSVLTSPKNPDTIELMATQLHEMRSDIHSMQTVIAQSRQ